VGGKFVEFSGPLVRITWHNGVAGYNLRGLIEPEQMIPLQSGRNDAGVARHQGSIGVEDQVRIGSGRFQAFDQFPYHVDIGLHTPEGIAARNRERERLEALLPSATQRRGQRVFGFSFEAPMTRAL